MSVKVLIAFKATEQQKATYQRAAEFAGLSYADFLKKAADDAAVKTFQNMIIEKLKRLELIFDRAGLSRDDVPWSKILDAADWFPDEQIEILESRSAEDVVNYLNMVLKTA